MNLKKAFALIVMFTIIISGCKQGNKPKENFSSLDISHIITKMTDIMVHDVTNPALAARFFSYACLAGYEIVSQNDSSCKSMHGILNGYPKIKKPENITNYSYQLSALLAMMETAGKMQPSGMLMQQYEKIFLDSCRKAGFSDNLIAHSKKYATNINEQILAYAKADGYNKISDYPRYTTKKGDGYWYPTPPAFFPAVEPYFYTIRPFTLDSCDQFKPKPPVAFSTDKGSHFYKMMMNNYEEGEELPYDHRVIASFWDCNPFALQEKGHLMVGLKRISPGAHWMGIAGIICKDKKTGFSKAMMINTVLAVGLMDSFISCWDEKYRSNRIRPETAIRKYIDPSWKPLLQTPPFPEYTSGHSCVSATSAVILTHFFGDKVHFKDSVEEDYGLAPSSFDSFKRAANEAAVSRFYGGIHYMDAVTNGLAQGQKVGEWVVAQTRKLK